MSCRVMDTQDQFLTRQCAKPQKDMLSYGYLQCIVPGEAEDASWNLLGNLLPGPAGDCSDVKDSCHLDEVAVTGKAGENRFIILTSSLKEALFSCSTIFLRQTRWLPLSIRTGTSDS
ncbi:hypothetical protein Y032_0023g724 [Ancylostoma ceylanicum]|uniref:Uncharacterized protein n=1 Tax=Ancylostoma ceylanicum TaxID=53326 RepID=A0A016UZ90_9BILA|nr:hypothetical protein Y032_0023g724 [Ancylostoma ceylanicum]